MKPTTKLTRDRVVDIDRLLDEALQERSPRVILWHARQRLRSRLRCDRPRLGRSAMWRWRRRQPPMRPAGPPGAGALVRMRELATPARRLREQDHEAHALA
jgi:hypothetical protein